MTILQVTMTILFLVGGGSLTWGSNKLSRLSHELYPDENYSGFRPSRRILKRIKEEHKDDKDSIKRLKEGKTLEILGLLTFITLFLTLFFGLK